LRPSHERALAIGRLTRHLADDALTGSDLSRRINAERLVLLGWTRAVLLQLAHPLIAAGVADHSAFRGGAAGAFSRLHHTVNAMLAITFGREADRQRALDAIRAIHRRIHGTLPAACGRFPAGTPYSAEDPALLLWVHATLADSILLAYEQLVAPLDDAERDQYCVDSADVAIALGATDDDVPRSWAALRAYLDREYASGSIEVGRQARDVAAALLSPVPGLAAGPVTALAKLLAAGLLPVEIRREYGFAWSDRREQLFRVGLRVFRGARRVLPRRITWWPQARLWSSSMRRSRA
jgi:uncharacterized protein (DUF2236 family)